MCPGEAKALFAGVRSPPVRGGTSPAWMAVRGKVGDDAEGGFLGGTHSVRPRCEAVPIPGHNMINGGNRTPGGLTGPSPGRKLGLLCGRAEPAPPRGGRPR